MIYTLTCNPSLDYIVFLDEFVLGEIARSHSQSLFAAGKGINVSIVLKNLGIESVCFGFIAGFTGQKIEEELQQNGCKTDFIFLEEGLSRINVKVKAKEETQINAQGPKISPKQLEALFLKLERLQKEDILVLSGSVPPFVENTIYEKIMEHLKSKGIKIVVDATKQLLLCTLKQKPFFVKPNEEELEEIFNCTIKTEEELIFYGQKMQKMGAQNVMISRGGKGAILLTEKEIYKSSAPKGNLIQTIGAGDSMVAGFLAGYLEKKSFWQAFQTAIAAGSASAFSYELAKKQEVEQLIKQITPTVELNEPIF